MRSTETHFRFLFVVKLSIKELMCINSTKGEAFVGRQVLESYEKLHYLRDRGSALGWRARVGGG